MSAASPENRISPQAYRTMREVEDSHWWFDGMEAISARLLDQMEPPSRSGADGKKRDILDAGCGTGRNLAFLRRYGEALGLDYSTVALDCCRARGFQRLVCGSVTALPLPDERFDLVTCFDVLATEGIDDRAALGEFARVLRPGGYLLLRVAAYRWLHSHHDREWAIGHRFERQELREKLSEAGLIVQRLSHANMWLLPAVLAKRLSERWTQPKSREGDLRMMSDQSLLSKTLRSLLASEAAGVASRWGLPCGLSLVAMARKPGTV